MNIGFIGLGTLGKTIAQRLVSEGINLTVWNRSIEKAEGLNCEISDNPADLISKTDIVFLNLFDSDAVNAVLKGKEGLLQGNCKGKIIVDTTTNHFDAVENFHQLVQRRGANYLEAPVLGSVAPASQGTLTVLISGNKRAYKKALPYIEKMGKTVFYLEEPALASKMKLVNNLTLGAFMTALSEAVIFGEAIGIEKGKVLDILDAGGGKSLVLSAKKEKLLKEDFSTHFSSACIYKDLHALQDLARELKKPLFTGSNAKELFSMVHSKGLEDLDFSAVYKVLKEI